MSREGLGPPRRPSVLDLRPRAGVSWPGESGFLTLHNGYDRAEVRGNATSQARLLAPRSSQRAPELSPHAQEGACTPTPAGSCGVGAVDVQGRACTQTVAVLSGGVPWGTAVTK